METSLKAVQMRYSKVFPRFWKISGKICSCCYELPRDLFRVFKEC